MRRRIPTLLLISATLAVTACGDNSSTAPVPSAQKSAGSTPSYTGYAVSADGDQTFASVNAATNSTTIPNVEFSPKGGSLNFGDLFTLTYRQGSVSLCDEGGTGCAPLTQSVTVSVTYGIVNGGPSIDIGTVNGKHLYFATPGAKLSTSYFAQSWQNILASGQHIGILYAPTFGATSELNAPKSHFNKGTGELWRWVSHFSGYAVSANCDPNDPTSCADSPDTSN